MPVATEKSIEEREVNLVLLEDALAVSESFVLWTHQFHFQEFISEKYSLHVHRKNLQASS